MDGGVVGDSKNDVVVVASQPGKGVLLEAGVGVLLPILGVVVGVTALITKLCVRVVDKSVVVIVGGNVTTAALIGFAAGVALGEISDGCCCH